MPGGDDHSACYTLTLSGAWQQTASMQQKRDRAASSHTDSGWLVTGGRDNIDDRLSTAEVFTDGSWTYSTTLPDKARGLNSHCQITVGGDQVFVIGSIIINSSKYLY